MKNLILLLTALASGPVLAQKTMTIEIPEHEFTYRFEGERSDDGLNKDAKADKPYTSLKLKDFHLGFRGKVDQSFDYRVLVNLIGSDGPRFDEGWVRWSNDPKTWQFVAGQQKINLWGFENKLFNAMTIFTSHGFANKMFEYAPAATLVYTTGGAGTLSFQAIEDVTPANGWNAAAGSKQQLAYSGEWYASGFDVGDAKLMPLFQVGTYDMGHSRVLSLGLDYQSKIARVLFDYIHDLWVAKGTETDAAGKTKAKKEENTRTTSVVNVEFNLDAVSPFAHFSIYNVRDYTAAGAEEPKANATPAAFNDNGKVIGLGTFFNGVSKKLRPYLAYEKRSGNFTSTSGKEKEMDVNSYRFGLAGAF